MRIRGWLLLYRAITWLVLITILILLPIIKWINPKFAKWFSLRFWSEPLSFTPKLWIHAVSMGEIKIALSLLDTQRDEHGQVPPGVLLTTSTQSGYRFLTEKMGKNCVRYLPWDVKFAYRRLFHELKTPNLIVVETEIWPTIFDMVVSSGANLVIVNGRLSSKTTRLATNTLFRRTISKVTRIAARSIMDRDRYLQFGIPIDRVTITGNIKYDFKPKALEEGDLSNWLNQPGPMLVFASISTDEVATLAPQAERLLDSNANLRILWAPRHLKDLEHHTAAFAGYDPHLRSQLGDQSPRLLMLDTFGELAGCYAFAELSLIGGSFNQRGGQNFLESLQAGTPAVMGPNTENFKREVDEALEAQTILCLQSPDQVAETMDKLLGDRESLKAMSDRAREYLARHAGAIKRTVSVLNDLKIFKKRIPEES